MIQLAYVSNAVQLMSEADLTALLQQARAINAEHGITGMLLYKDRSFLQVLEGDSESVHTIYARITRDARHEKVRTLYDEPIHKRDFSDWTMGFRNLTGSNLESLVGYTDFMDKPDVARTFFEDLTTAKKLLLLFRSKS
jgi:hypothetical protein